VQALVEQKRRAHQSRGFDRLFEAVPSARKLMDHLAGEGKILGAATSGLLQLPDRVSAETLEGAVAAAIVRDQFHLRAVHPEVDRRRHAAGLPPPLSSGGGVGVVFGGGPGSGGFVVDVPVLVVVGLAVGVVELSIPLLDAGLLDEPTEQRAHRATPNRASP
jgi:hypothetical protein